MSKKLNSLATSSSVSMIKNIDDVDKTMDEINEQTDNMKQIQDALSAPFGSAADFDEFNCYGGVLVERLYFLVCFSPIYGLSKLRTIVFGVAVAPTGCIPIVKTKEELKFSSLIV
ncbi:hypothetical protein DY000_02043115 [Brassica cretica]|uniref:Uncharacterized protein n=1 Tax=Brassica cretica TaxID=69181 RepID=A0ABQ7B6E8_BRACR|nr:hypothetical protein DY000_02043115 [Brassica cretica]